ncbi:MAG: Nif3-like dinuclear metal center hexameric protein [Deltaproteobacteria bacterium]|nr:Nif3-like dinuclear metal center hexameric protein [Deltaproteobacteria bacterium]
MDVAALLAVLDELAPPKLAEPWDNVGLLVGDPSRALTRALLAIDYTPAVAREAREGGFEAVVAYHPPVFQGLKRVLAGTAVYDAVRDGVALYAPHTALDIAEGGTNDVLADLVGMTSRAPVKVLTDARARLSERPLGLGRIGPVEPVERAELLQRIKAGLGVGALLVAGPTEGVVRSVAVGAGACGDLLDDVLARGAGLYLTGELRHHDALKAAAAGLTVVCALHSNSERVTLPRLAERLRERLPALEVRVSAEDRDPFGVR